MNEEHQKIALVTGGTGAIGSEICKQLAQKGYKVILGGRDTKKLDVVLETLNNDSNIIPHILDITSEENVTNIYKFIIENFGTLDVLVNNAAVFLDNQQGGFYPDFFDLEVQNLHKTMEVNLYGAFRLSQLFVPIMQANNYGRIVNVSSRMSCFQGLDNNGPFYRMSKVALNSLTCILANLCQGWDICINSVCPGWVRSNMGGKFAPRPPVQGAAGIIWAATLPSGGPTGEFFHDKKALNW